MTTDELIHKFNHEFGLSKWPDYYGVDAETYVNVCQFIFNHNSNFSINGWIRVAIGPNNGIMFKNVELILSKPIDVENV